MTAVRLVLGSGGARGMAHIGVIEQLMHYGFSIREVAGSSMGAVVGGIYCAGYLDEYKHWLIKLNKLDVLRLLDFTVSSQGFVKGERVFKAIADFIGDHQIDHFKIPFTAVVSDVTNRKEVHYRSGSLFRALRASIAIPTIFTPVTEGKAQLVDGGVLNPLPLNVVAREPDDLIVAVNLNADTPGYKTKVPVLAQTEKAAYIKLLEAFRTQVFGKEIVDAEEQVEKFGFFDLITRSVDLTQERLTELMINMYKPDIVVNISREACGVFEFYRANEIIEEGRVAFRHAYENYLSEQVKQSVKAARVDNS
jgi:NTE family protein